MVRRLYSTTVFSAICILGSVVSARAAQSNERTLTFFGWSDQHIAVDGEGSHLIPAIDAMNALPGADYPAQIGGKVARPAFVFGLGDITEWPTNAAKNTYDELITKRLKFPSYDIAGNHDSGGKEPSPTVENWIVARHGALSYTFDKGGVHFIALHSEYDENLNSPAQPLSRAALDFVRKDLAKVPKDTPVVVAAHLCYDAMTNRDELVEVCANANVILILGGHYHKAKVDKYKGCNFVQLPSPAPNGENEFTVVRITSNRLVAIPYSYKKKAWTPAPRKTLDAAIQGPKPLPADTPAKAQ